MDRRSHMDLNNLTIPERTRVFEDLAGTSPIQNEDLFELVIAIKEMNQQLASRTSKNAFEIARKQNPEYTLDPGFFLMFLRANEYDPKRAAEMVVAHFEEKLILFGEEKLTKNIELSDLSEDDMYSLESGGFQVSRSKDKAGRNIAFFRKGDYRWKNIENWVRN